MKKIKSIDLVGLQKFSFVLQMLPVVLFNMMGRSRPFIFTPVWALKYIAQLPKTEEMISPPKSDMKDADNYISMARIELELKMKSA